MRICVLAVGKLRDGPMKGLYADYAGRLPWKLQTTEIADRNNDPPKMRVRREGEELRRRLPGGPLIALDETGTDLTSEAFAALLGQWRDNGADTVSFAIGGADGHCPDTLSMADRVLSFGNATWPHQMVRGMLAEQLYRASTILNGHPYHRRGKAG